MITQHAHCFFLSFSFSAVHAGSKSCIKDGADKVYQWWIYKRHAKKKKEW